MALANKEICSGHHHSIGIEETLGLTEIVRNRFNIPLLLAMDLVAKLDLNDLKRLQRGNFEVIRL